MVALQSNTINQTNQDELLTRITRTVELIKMYSTGIRQAMSMEAPLYLIESKERMKTELVSELITLLAEIDVQFELKQAA
jgi:hypothetical protein